MENYPEAALRHWNDAELLIENSRIENADHHYGFAAECAIKKALVMLPAFSKKGVLEETYLEHINILWDRVTHQSLQKVYPELLAVLRSKNPFSGWHVRQRYAKDGEILDKDLSLHKKFASRLLGSVGLIGGR